MPSKEFLELVALVDSWSKHDKEYLWECSLKEDAPDYVRSAFEAYKKQMAEFEAEGVNV